ncbi:MAG: hypothetical protein OEW24_04785 [Chloroflexota bacterium]|nr:hypothetical protein [Chloroflexota bacterium]
MSTRTKVALAVGAGLVVFAALFEWGGVVTTDPPTCYGMFWYHVPCEAWVAPLAAASTAGVVALLLWWWDRRK